MPEACCLPLPQTPQPVASGYQEAARSRRHKTRESFTLPGHPEFGAWQLDLTEVLTEDRAGPGAAAAAPGAVSYEAELELTAEGREAWLRNYGSTPEADQEGALSAAAWQARQTNTANKQQS